MASAFLFTFMRVVVRAGFVTASLWYSLGAFHHERVAQIADAAGRLCLDCISAVWIV